MASNPSASLVFISSPFSLSMMGSIPKKGLNADPGFKFFSVASGVIKMPPVSVCHHVSTIGHHFSPTIL